MTCTRFLLLAVFALAGLAACGKSEPPDPTKPLSGKAPSDGDDLVGTWVMVTDGDYLGLDFQKGGKVVVTSALTSLVAGTNAGLLMNFTLEKGRLNLVHQGAMAYTYDLVLAGDQMELKGEMPASRVPSQRFKRLPSGQTLQQAIKALKEAEAKSFQDRVAAVEPFLKLPDLVLSITGPGHSSAIAVEFPTVAKGSFSGKAWHDEKPPHLDAISGQIVKNEQEGKLQLQFQFGARIEPLVPGAAGGGQVVLKISGEPPNLKIAGTATDRAKGTSLELALKSDPALHAEIQKRFQAELARIEALKQPLVAALKDYAVLEGRSGTMGNLPGESADRVVLVRAGAPGGWAGEGTSTNPQSGAVENLNGVIAAVVIQNDKAFLQIVTPGRQYRLSLEDPASGKLTGVWSPPGNPQGKRSEFAIVQAADAETRAKRVLEERTLLSGLAGAAPYIGVYNTRGDNGRSAGFMPVSVLLGAGPNGTVAGTVKFLLGETVMNAQGQVADSPLGPLLRLSLSDSGKPGGDAMFIMSMRNQPWILRVAEATEGGLRLSCSSPGTGLFDLVRADDPWKARERQKLTEALRTGLRFRALHPVRSDLPPSFVEMKLAPEGGSITGTVIEGRQLSVMPNSAIAGELKDQEGFLLLATKISDPPTANRAHIVYAADMLAIRQPRGWFVVSPIYPTHQPKARGSFDLVEAGP
jgi:hypothetical protein